MSKEKKGMHSAAFAKTVGEAEWVSLDDIDAIAAALPNNCLCGSPVIRKHLGNPFQGSPDQFGCRVVDQGRIPSEIIRTVEQKLVTKGGK